VNVVKVVEKAGMATGEEEAAAEEEGAMACRKRGEDRWTGGPVEVKRMVSSGEGEAEEGPTTGLGWVGGRMGGCCGGWGGVGGCTVVWVGRVKRRV
jgi:hypothetical protein